METIIAEDKKLERHNLFVKFVRIFSVPIQILCTISA